MSHLPTVTRAVSTVSRITSSLYQNSACRTYVEGIFLFFFSGHVFWCQSGGLNNRPNCDMMSVWLHVSCGHLHVCTVFDVEQLHLECDWTSVYRINMFSIRSACLDCIRTTCNHKETGIYRLYTLGSDQNLQLQPWLCPHIALVVAEMYVGLFLDIIGGKK